MCVCKGILLGKAKGESSVGSDPGMGFTRSPSLETVRAEDDALELETCVCRFPRE